MTRIQSVQTDNRIAANLASQLGLEGAIEACKQKKWFGVLRALRQAPGALSC